MILELEQTPGERVAGALRRRGMSLRRLTQAVNDQHFLLEEDLFREEELVAFMEGESTLDTHTLLAIAEGLRVTPGWIEHGGESPAIEQENDPLLATMIKGLYDRYGSLIPVLQRVELAAIALKILKSSPGGIEALGDEADAIATRFAQDLFMLVRAPMMFLRPPEGEADEREYMRGALISLNALVSGGAKLGVEETSDAISRVGRAQLWQLTAPDKSYDEYCQSLLVKEPELQIVRD